VRIRPFRESDEEAVEVFWRAIFPGSPSHSDPSSDIRRKLAVQRELFLVAEESGVVIGTAMAGYDGHRGWVYYVSVHPEHRRKGVGAALMTTAENGLRRAGCSKVNLQVRPGNDHAVAFYERLGYTVEERVSMGKLLEKTDG